MKSPHSGGPTRRRLHPLGTGGRDTMAMILLPISPNNYYLTHINSTGGTCQTLRQERTESVFNLGCLRWASVHLAWSSRPATVTAADLHKRL